MMQQLGLGGPLRVMRLDPIKTSGGAAGGGNTRPENRPTGVDNLRHVSLWIGVLVAALCLGLIGSEIRDQETERASQIAEVETATRNLARSLAQQADDSLGMADTVLFTLVERLEVDGTSPEALARLRGLLSRHAAALPRVRSLFVYGADGRWLATSFPNPPVGLDNSDRAYFRFHQSSPERRAHLGPPINSRSDGASIITVSRRFDRPDGSFAGIVLATLDVEYFSRFHRTFDLGERGSVALLSQGGTVLSRFPLEQRVVGRDLSQEPFFRDIAAGGPGGSFRVRSPLDGVDRIAGFRKGSAFPIVVVVAVSKDEALAEWRANAVRSLLNVGGLALVAAAVGILLVRKLGHVRVFQTALAENEANFRLLAESADDMVSRVGPDAVRRYVSPASRRLLGREPADMVGRSALADFSAEDRQNLERAIDRLRGRAAEALTVTHRALHADGTALWLETTLRLAFAADTGEPDGVVAVSRDVTARKSHEAELAALASRDGLTGLANRRVFDEALASELRSARRDDLPLSLVLLDLDRFKLFNDTYGHVAGDAALSAVAKILGRSTHRRGDLAVRYGGEEMALVLPGTDEAGARLVAERVRAEVAKLGIPHSENRPAETVTLSVGLATCVPARQAGGRVRPADLIEAADRALYAAKREGRNTVRSAPLLAATRQVASEDAVA